MIERDCRFHVSYNFLKQSTMFNWRYWLPFKKEQANNTPEYLKRKSNSIDNQSIKKENISWRMSRDKKAV